jgi:long-chain acyl-CoA synthetase
MWHMSGVSIYYAENLGTIAKDMNELQVEGFITVPRLLESIFEKIISKARTLSPVKRMIFRWALHVGNKYEPYTYKNPLYRLSHKIVDVLVFKKWRQALSMKIQFIGCGGAALQPRLARLFWAAGLPVFEGYGLTETSPIISVNYWKKDGVKLGSVGPILEGVSVKIADDGEILAKGPNIMLGYYKDEEHTAEMKNEEGWFCTGDIGEIVNGRFLRITDRKKEIFKMSNGKYIAPQQIENKLKESFLIQQTMVVGENQKFASAIILPNFSELNDWCKKHGINATSNLETIKIPQVIKHFEHEIKKLNKHFGSFEQIKKIALVADEWSPVTGELSPSLKLKRKVIFEKYRSLVDNLYLQKTQAQSIPVSKK